IYCDNRIIMSYPAERRLVTERLAEAVTATVDPKQIDTIAGVATSGIPFAAWLAERLDRPMVYVRDAPKEHGRGRAFEGNLPPGHRVVVVEDLVTTGKSALQTVEGLRDAQAVVEHSTAIVSYESPAAEQAFKSAGVTLIPL